MLFAVFPSLGWVFGLDGFGTRSGAGGGLLFGLAIATAIGLLMPRQPADRSRSSRTQAVTAQIDSLPVRPRPHGWDRRWAVPPVSF